MCKTMYHVRHGFLMPVIKKIVMKKSTSDKGSLINFQVKLYHKEICGIRHSNAMFLNRGIAVLNEISHIIKT